MIQKSRFENIGMCENYMTFSLRYHMKITQNTKSHAYDIVGDTEHFVYHDLLFTVLFVSFVLCCDALSTSESRWNEEHNEIFTKIATKRVEKHLLEKVKINHVKTIKISSTQVISEIMICTSQNIYGVICDFKTVTIRYNASNFQHDTKITKRKARQMWSHISNCSVSSKISL